MKNIQIITAFILSVVLFSCGTVELTTIPPKMTEDSNFPLEYFRDYTYEEEKTQHVIQLFPDERPNKEPIDQNAFVKPKTKISTDDLKEEVTENGNLKIPDDSSNIPLYPNYSGKKIFQIVCGSFRIKTNAEQFLSILRNLGYRSALIKKSENGYYRVIVEEFNIEDEVNQYLESFKKLHPKYAEAWISELKKTNLND